MLRALTRTCLSTTRIPTVRRSMSTLTHLKEAVSRLTPLSLAEKSWDNVGLLIEAPYSRDEKLQGDSKRKIVLCIDCSSFSSSFSSSKLTFCPHSDYRRPYRCPRIPLNYRHSHLPPSHLFRPQISHFLNSSPSLPPPGNRSGGQHLHDSHSG
jgi:hypothetical protein